VREEEFRSGMISDALEISSDESNTSDEEGQGKSKGKKSHGNAAPEKSASSTTGTRSKSVLQKGVPAPRHKRQASQSNLGTEAAEFFSSNVEFLKATANSDNEQLKLLKKREAREDKHYEFTVEKGRAEVTLAEREAKVKNA